MSKREWLSKQPHPTKTGEFLAKYPARGRFSREALEAVAAAEQRGESWTEPEKPEPKQKTVTTGKGTDPKPASEPKPQEAPLPALDAGTVRAWAQENGVEVSARGRVSNEVKRAFLDSGQKPEDAEVKKPQEFGPTPPMVVAAGTRFFGEVEGKRVSVGTTEVCSNTQYSIGWCPEPEHVVVRPDGRGQMTVSRKP